MFPHKERISRAEFPILSKTGRRVCSPRFNIVVETNNGVSARNHGYSVVVSKKVARLSVTRHRLKRQVVAALKSLSNGLPAALIVFPRVSAVDMDFKDIKAELVTLLSKIRK